MKSTAIPTNTGRIQSVDVLRGLIMVLMAIDHVRVYSGIPAGGPDPGIFFTRWVTHFCAPGFAFLAGTSAFLYGAKIGNTAKLAQFLVTRGIFLVILEITVIRFLWAFHVNFSEFFLAGVIWMLGWCMVLLAAFVRLKPQIVGWIGLGIISFQQLFSYVPLMVPESGRPAFGKIWEFVYPAGLETFSSVSVLYVLVPWIGVMAAGYGFGLVLQLDAERRRRICLRIGLGAIALFLVAGTIRILMNPASAETPPFLFRLLNQNKYPASQLFLLMTLGPLIALIPYADRMKGWLATALRTIGRVPFFYYLLHIPLIHISALAIQLIKDGGMHHDWFTYAPYTSIPDAFRWNLGLLYLVYAVDVAILYFICRWYAGYKAAHPGNQWLKFL